MRPFPPASELQFLVGKQVEQICLGYWRFEFQFEIGGVVVEGDFEHVDRAATVHRHNTDADRAAPLYVHQLIGQKVIDVSVEQFRLTVTFEQGDRLRILSEDGPYENGQIYNEAGKLVVF